MFPDRVEVCVPSSKTDQLGRGTTVVIPSQRDIKVCPVKKLKEYLLVRGACLMIEEPTNHTLRYSPVAFNNPEYKYKSIIKFNDT
jgi:hypothetical protein